MTPDGILDGVRAVLAGKLDIQSHVTVETDLLRDLQLDSIQALTLVVELENHFRVCFEPGDEGGLATVGDLVSLVERRLSASGAAA